MRWIAPRHGDEKLKRKFALFPIKVKTGEIRWLEFVTILYRFSETHKSFGWNALDFVDKSKIKVQGIFVCPNRCKCIGEKCLWFREVDMEHTLYDPSYKCIFKMEPVFLKHLYGEEKDEERIICPHNHSL